MISKRLFFIWFGDNEPPYVNFSIQNFKKVNPDFEINFLRYTVSDIENRNKVGKYDSNVYNCLDYILQKNPSRYSYAISEYKSYKRLTLQILSNIVRLDLLNEYGGIYLDCDTFPLKPFDYVLLRRENFCAQTFHTYWNPTFREKDCFFIGSNTKYILKKYTQIWNTVNVGDWNFFNTQKWKDRKNMFFECKLEYHPVNNEYYIEHFQDETWRKNKNNIIRTPQCKYDKELYD